MMLQGAVGPQSLVIIQAEITDSEGIVWLHRLLTHFLPTVHAAIQQAPSLEILQTGSIFIDKFV